MKKVRWYIPNVLLTFLLVVLILATELVFYARMQVLNADAFRTVVQQEQLADKVYTSLEGYFKTRSNSTGIPAEVYMDAMDREALHEAILTNVSQAFDYLNSKTESYEFKMDFTALEASVTAFFEEYADENGYEKDEKYQKKLNSTIKNAETRILSEADTFKLSMMNQKGWLKMARRYVSYLNMASTICIIAVVVILFLLILCNLKQIGHFFYWLGIAALTAGALLLTPCVYVKATDFYTSFTIKDPQIYAAVVGLLNLLTKHAMTIAIATLIAAVILLIVFTFICGLRWEDEEVEEKLAESRQPKKAPKSEEATPEEAAEPEAAPVESEETKETQTASEKPEVEPEEPETAPEENEETPEENEETPEENEETPEENKETPEEPEATEDVPKVPEVAEVDHRRTGSNGGTAKRVKVKQRKPPQNPR